MPIEITVALGEIFLIILVCRNSFSDSIKTHPTRLKQKLYLLCDCVILPLAVIAIVAMCGAL